MPPVTLHSDVIEEKKRRAFATFPATHKRAPQEGEIVASKQAGILRLQDWSCSVSQVDPTPTARSTRASRGIAPKKSKKLESQERQTRVREEKKQQRVANQEVAKDN